MVDSAAALITAAIWPKDKQPPREYGILPQQTEDQLILGEAHSKLDSALAFLQKHVGYAMLDDAAVRPGGAVGIKTKYKASHSGGMRVGAANEGRWPKEAMSVPAREAVPLSNRDNLRDKLIRLAEERVEREKELEEAKTVILPAAAKYAHFEEDLMLTTRFTSMLCTGHPGAVSKVKNQGVYKTILQAVRLLHLCEYEYTDVVLVLAHASVYFRSTFAAVGHRMGEHEAAHVIVLLIYLAHSFILDISCPLRCWQKHIFRKYCGLKVLDAALFRLFRTRSYLLRITEEDEKAALIDLLGHKTYREAEGQLSTLRSQAGLNETGYRVEGPVALHYQATASKDVIDQEAKAGLRATSSKDVIDKEAKASSESCGPPSGSPPESARAG